MAQTRGNARTETRAPSYSDIEGMATMLHRTLSAQRPRRGGKMGSKTHANASARGWNPADALKKARIQARRARFPKAED